MTTDEQPDAITDDSDDVDAVHERTASRRWTIALWVISAGLILLGVVIYLQNWPSSFGYNFPSEVYTPSSDGNPQGFSVFNNPQVLGFAGSQLLLAIAPPMIVLGLATGVANIVLIGWSSVRSSR